MNKSATVCCLNITGQWGTLLLLMGTAAYIRAFPYNYKYNKETKANYKKRCFVFLLKSCSLKFFWAMQAPLTQYMKRQARLFVTWLHCRCCASRPTHLNETGERKPGSESLPVRRRTFLLSNVRRKHDRYHVNLGNVLAARWFQY